MIIIVAFMILTHLGSPSDIVMAPGVKAEDEFTYEIKSFWNSQDPETVPSDSFFEFNQTEWFKVTVTGVSEAEVSINTTWRFKNGTKLEGIGTMNVETGMPYPTGGFWAIYAASLKAGDNVRPIGPDRSTINETATRQHANGTRETNRITLVQESCDANDPTHTRTWIEYMNNHFDRQTGMLFELRDTNVYTNPDMTLTILWMIIDTNVWTVS